MEIKKIIFILHEPVLKKRVGSTMTLIHTLVWFASSISIFVSMGLLLTLTVALLWNDNFTFIPEQGCLVVTCLHKMSVKSTVNMYVHYVKALDTILCDKVCQW